jgi:hypothetical protein
MIKIFLFVVVMVITTTGIFGQSLSPSVVSTAGASYSNATGQLSITMGEAVQAYYTNGSASLSVGFQQAFPAAIKQLLLTLFLEGLYDGPTMRKAQNTTGDQYAGSVADRISVVLHQSTAPYTELTTLENLDLNTNGAAQASVPGTYGGSYYLAIKNRNHLETWTASPVSFAGSSISYNFTNAANKAYGNQMKDLGEGIFGIYAGDVNTDGHINLTDINTTASAATAFATGYVATDANGDGSIDALDLILVDNNAANAVSLGHP